MHLLDVFFQVNRKTEFQPVPLCQGGVDISLSGTLDLIAAHLSLLLSLFSFGLDSGPTLVSRINISYILQTCK